MAALGMAVRLEFQRLGRPRALRLPPQTDQRGNEFW